MESTPSTQRELKAFLAQTFRGIKLPYILTSVKFLILTCRTGTRIKVRFVAHGAGTERQAAGPSLGNDNRLHCSAVWRRALRYSQNGEAIISRAHGSLYYQDNLPNMTRWVSTNLTVFSGMNSTLSLFCSATLENISGADSLLSMFVYLCMELYVFSMHYFLSFH